MAANPALSPGFRETSHPRTGESPAPVEIYIREGVAINYAQRGDWTGAIETVARAATEEAIAVAVRCGLLEYEAQARSELARVRLAGSIPRIGPPPPWN